MLFHIFQGWCQTGSIEGTNANTWLVGEGSRRQGQTAEPIQSNAEPLAVHSSASYLITINFSVAAS